MAIILRGAHLRSLERRLDPQREQAARWEIISLRWHERPINRTRPGLIAGKGRAGMW